MNTTQLQTHLLVDTDNGLKIVKATQANFFNSNYSVQLVGSEEECKAEKKRLNSY